MQSDIQSHPIFKLVEKTHSLEVCPRCEKPHHIPLIFQAIRDKRGWYVAHCLNSVSEKIHLRYDAKGWPIFL